MCRGDGVAADKIGDGTGHAQDALAGAGGKMKLVDGAFEQGAVVGCERAVAFGEGLREGGVGNTCTLRLAGAGGVYAGADDGAGFAARAIGAQLRGGNAGDFDLEIDAIQ